MKIPNPALIKEFSQPGPCQVCKVHCQKREAHHLWHRTPEITIRINVIALGSTPLFCCSCHTDVGTGKIPFNQTLEIVAAREHTSTEAITEVMNLFRRLVKPTEMELLEGLESLLPTAKALAIRELMEAGVVRWVRRKVTPVLEMIS